MRLTPTRPESIAARTKPTAELLAMTLEQRAALYILSKRLLITEGWGRERIARELKITRRTIGVVLYGLGNHSGKGGDNANAHSPEEKARRLVLIRAVLADGGSMDAAAAAGGVSHETARRWMYGDTGLHNRSQAKREEEFFGLSAQRAALPKISDTTARERMARVRFPNTAAWHAF